MEAINYNSRNKVVCPGCGLELESDDSSLDERYNASAACRGLYDRLAAFTQSRGDKDFIHQIAVDAYTAQHLGPEVKPIGGTFALVGLFLAFERGYTGRQVQLAHMALGKTKRDWPRFEPSKGTAKLTVADALRGLDEKNYRDRINAWGKAVWDLWKPEHGHVAALVNKFLLKPECG